MSNRRCTLLFFAAFVILAGSQFAWALSGTWDAGSGNWSPGVDPPWSGGVIANGATFDADFSSSATADGGQTITNNVDPTIGTMEFGNGAGSGSGWWNLDGGTVTLDNGPSTPVISAYVFLNINSALAGNNGVEFAGYSWNVVTLSNTNNYTGGTTLSSPTVSISSLGNIGGAASTINFNSGTLQVTGTAVNNLDTNTVNWASFNGGIDVADPTNTFSISSIITGNNLWKKGAGSLQMNADSNFSGNVNCNGGGNLNLVGIATVLSSGSSLNVATDGSLTSGTLNVGTLATRATDNVTVNANAGLYVGGGVGAGGNGTVNVYGTSTINSLSYYANVVQLSTYGSGTGTLNMYDSSKLNTGTLLLANPDDTNGDVTRGYVNLYDNAIVTTDNVVIASKSDPRIVGNESKVTLNNYSKINTTNMTVGDQGSAILTINDHAQVNVSGTLKSSFYAFWAPPGYGSAYGNTAEIDVNGGQLNAGTISMEGNWCDGNCLTTMNVTGDATVTTTGDFMAARWATALATITIDKNAQVNVDGLLTLGVGQGGHATLNLTCGDGETASLTANQMIVGGRQSSDGWAWTQGALNVSGKATATITNDLIIGQGINADGKVNVSGDASLSVGGALWLSKADSATASLTVSNNANITVSGTTTLANNSTMTLDSTGLLSFKAITDNGTGTVEVGDALGTVNATATATSLAVNTLNVHTGSTFVIAGNINGPLSGLDMTAVPEPSTIVMLIIAAMGLGLAAWRRK